MSLWKKIKKAYKKAVKAVTGKSGTKKRTSSSKRFSGASSKKSSSKKSSTSKRSTKSSSGSSRKSSSGSSKKSSSGSSKKSSGTKRTNNITSKTANTARGGRAVHTASHTASHTSTHSSAKSNSSRTTSGKATHKSLGTSWLNNVNKTQASNAHGTKKYPGVQKKAGNSARTSAKKAYEKGKDVTYLGSKQKTTTTKLKDGTKLKSVNALTKTEFNRMVDASRHGKGGNQLLKANKRTGQKDIREKVGSKTAESAYKSKAATGAMQGLSKADVFSGVGTYNKQAKKAIKETKESAAYNIGYAAGMIADMALGGTTSKGMSAAAIAEKVGNKVIKKTAEKAAKEAAVEGAKKAAKETADKTAKKVAKKTFAKNRVGELVSETGQNFLDAAKMSMDENGKVDRDKMKKYLALNTGLTVAGGSAVEGIAGAVTAKQAKKATALLRKQSAGTATKKESEELGKIVSKIAKKSGEDTDTVSSVLAKDSAKKIRTTAEEERLLRKSNKAKTRARNKANAQKREDVRYAFAKADSDKEKAFDTMFSEASDESARIGRVQSNARKKAEHEAQVVEKASKLPSSAELQTKRATLTSNLNNLKGYRKEAKTEGEAKLLDSAIEKVEKDLETNRREINTVQHAETIQFKNSQKSSISASESADGAITQSTGETTVRAENKAEEGITATERAMAEYGHDGSLNIEDLPDDLKEAVPKESYEEEKAAIEATDKAFVEYRKTHPAYKEFREAEELQKEWDDLMESIPADKNGIPQATAEQEKRIEEIRNRADELGYELGGDVSNEYAHKRDVATRKAYEDFRKTDEYKQIWGETSSASEADTAFSGAKSDTDITTASSSTKAETATETKGSASKAEASQVDELHRKAKVSSKPVTELSDAELKKEKSSLYFGIKNGKTPEHIELRKARQAEVEAEITARKNKTKVSETKSLPQRASSVSDSSDNVSKVVRESRTNDLRTSASNVRKDSQKVRMAITDIFAPLEDAANAKAKGEKNLALARINELRKASKTGQAKMATEGRPIYEKAGLTKRGAKAAEKRADYEEYCFLKHDLDRQAKDTEYLGKSREEIISDINRLETKYAENIGELKTFQKSVVAYFDSLLQREVDSGVSSVEAAAKLRKDYPNYVPSFKDKDFTDALDTAISDEIDLSKRMKAAKGSDGEPLVSLYDQMAVKTNTVMKRTELNKTMNTLYDLCGTTEKEADEVLEGATDAEKAEVLRDSQVYTEVRNGKYTVVTFDNGEKVTNIVDENVYNAIKHWSGEEKRTFFLIKALDSKVLQGAASQFKKWITDYNVLFGIKNGIRDFETALFYTKDLKGFMKAYMPALAQVYLPKKLIPKSWSKYTEIFEAYKKNGGIYSQFITSGKMSAELLDAVKVSNYNPLKFVEEFNSMIETVPRLTEYISAVESAAKKQNKSISEILKNDDAMAEAMFRSKDVTLNFDRSGWLGKKLNKGAVPFFNPAVQGLSKLGRKLVTENIDRASGKVMAGETAKNFLKLGVGLSAMVAMPTMAWNALFGDYINGKVDGYEKQSDYNRYSNYLLPVGDGYFVKIPKARELASMQATLDFIYDNMKYGKGNVWERLFSDESVRDASSLLELSWEQVGTVNPLTDGLINPILNTAGYHITMHGVEKNENGFTWYGGNIENSTTDEAKRMEGKYSEIWDENTSAVARAVGSAFNISPKKVDNILDSYLGIIYDMGISQTSLKNSHKGESFGQGILSILKSSASSAFVVDSIFSNSYKSDNYAMSKKWEEKLETLKEGSDEYNKLKAKINRNSNSFSYVSMSYDELTAQIYLDSSLTAAEKKAYVRQLKVAQNKLWRANVNGELVAPEDPMKTAWNLKDKNGKRVLSADKIIDSCSFTFKGDDGKLGTKDDYNVIKDAWKKYKKSGGKTEKFMNVTMTARDINRYCGESLTFVAWKTVAYASVLGNHKNSQKVLDAYGVYDSQVEEAKKYAQYGGSLKTYKVSHRTVTQAAYDLGLDYTSKMEQWDKANALAHARTKAGKKYRDLAYYAEDKYTLAVMNAARCLANGFPKSNWTTEKIHKFCLQNGFSYLGDGDYPSNDPDAVAAAINKKWRNKSNEEKAAIFQEICSYADNPFGSVGDYSLNTDTGISYSSSYGSGRGYGYGGRGRGGGGSGGSGGNSGGSGGSSGTGIKTTIKRGSSKKASHSSISGGASSSKAPSSPTFKVTDTMDEVSNLNEAYRKKLKKALKKS